MPQVKDYYYFYFTEFYIYYFFLLLIIKKKNYKLKVERQPHEEICYFSNTNKFLKKYKVVISGQIVCQDLLDINFHHTSQIVKHVSIDSAVILSPHPSPRIRNLGQQ